MSWFYGIAVTGAVLIGYYAFVALMTQFGVPTDSLKIIEMMLDVAILVGSAYWVYTDSQKIEVSKYEGFVAGTPVGLAVVCVLLWPLFFPAYMQKRYMIKNRLAKLKPEFHPNYRKPE